MNLNYEKDVTIDESALDVEWLAQPKLMLTYGNHAAEKRKEVDLAKEKLDVVKAELDRKIRENPEIFGLPKITETVVQNTIIIQPEYKKASENYIETKYELDMAMSAVRAIDQKKQALENLVRLHGQQYFAGPKVPRDLSQEWINKQRQKQSDAKVAKAMRRK
jgi:hypothetical protein